MKKDGHEGLKVQSCILLVSKSHGFLGMSADGLVEVKNIKCKENENLKMAGKGIGNRNGIINKSHL